ncbi:transposase family protein [Trichocoleus sp. Lan]|uniref:transposase family protein n=1 Tax=Trichocoleus sp. Lan TaxID=2933927 RepID=UPI003297B375
MNSTAKLFNELLPNQEQLKLHNFELGRDHRRIVFFGCFIQPTNACRLCGQSTHRVHSHYIRRLADLSWADYEIALQVKVRKFFCYSAPCQRRIFTERILSGMAL